MDTVVDSKAVNDCSKEMRERVFKSMTTLNKYACDVLKKYDVHALTDVTGFGLLVHLNEMLDEKNSAVIYKDSIPYFDECQKKSCLTHKRVVAY